MYMMPSAGSATARADCGFAQILRVGYWGTIGVVGDISRSDVLIEEAQSIRRTLNPHACAAVTYYSTTFSRIYIFWNTSDGCAKIKFIWMIWLCRTLIVSPRGVWFPWKPWNLIGTLTQNPTDHFVETQEEQAIVTNPAL